MTDPLLDIPPSPSPRLKWMAENCVKLYFCPTSDDGQWWAWCGERDAMEVLHGSHAYEFFAQADTEDEAITGHAKRRGIPLWNEASFRREGGEG